MVREPERREKAMTNEDKFRGQSILARNIRVKKVN